MKYLARKHGLVARNESEQIRVDYTEAEAQDMRMAWAYLCYGPDFVSVYQCLVFINIFQMSWFIDLTIVGKK